jgi:hypothetical protein
MAACRALPDSAGGGGAGQGGDPGVGEVRVGPVHRTVDHADDDAGAAWADCHELGETGERELREHRRFSSPARTVIPWPSVRHQLSI